MNLSKNINDLKKRWAPPEGLTVSQWAEKYRVLVSETSSEPGPWRNIRTPYLVKIMDAFSDPYIEKIVFNKGSQLGGTEAIYNMLGYAIHQDPAPALCIMPTLELAKYASKSRIQPMIAASSVLKERKPYNDDDFTNFQMLFPGMVLTMAGANSPASLASRPCRYVFLDEVNKFPRFAGDEADPISLATERQKTFWNKKTVIISTPTTEDGQITKEMAMCDVIFDYWVPCPHCGKSQTLSFAQIKWSKELDSKDPLYASKVRDSAWYECSSCAGIITDQHRPAMIQGGEWKPRQALKHQPRTVGFSLPSFYSPWLTWGDMAEIFVKSKDYPEKLMNVVNSWFAEPWVQRIKSSTTDEILKARTDLPPQTLPEEAIALTAGVDCQKYGFWFCVRAWARDMTNWLIHYGQVTAWEDLERLLFETKYSGGNGHALGIWRAAVDTGGGDVGSGLTMTEEAYWWIRKHGIGRGCRVWATKGSSSPLAGKLRIGQVLDKTPSGKPIPGGLQLIMIDTAEMKDTYHWRLQQAFQQLPQAAYLHSEVGEDYARHVMAEEKRKDKKGVERWVQVGRENHLFDADLLAMVCAEPEWPGGGVNIFGPMQPVRKGDDEWQNRPRPPEPSSRQHPGLRGRNLNPYLRQ